MYNQSINQSINLFFQKRNKHRTGHANKCRWKQC